MSLSVFGIRITNSYLLRWAKIEPSKKVSKFICSRIALYKCEKYCPVTITFKRQIQSGFEFDFVKPVGNGTIFQTTLRDLGSFFETTVAEFAGSLATKLSSDV